jgi:predicted DNA-binding ribbon-helix-helix protein
LWPTFFSVAALFVQLMGMVNCDLKEPVMNHNESHKKATSFRLSAATRKRLREIAAETGMTQSAVIDAVIRQAKIIQRPLLGAEIVHLHG